jgi:hypothetical protein
MTSELLAQKTPAATSRGFFFYPHEVDGMRKGETQDLKKNLLPYYPCIRVPLRFKPLYEFLSRVR